MNQVKKTEEVAVVDQKTNGKKKAVVRTKKPPENITMEMVLYEAVQRGIDPDGMEKVLGLIERREAKVSESEFNIAMAKFQGDIPTIIAKKGGGKKDNSGKSMYKYAPIEAIMSFIKKPLSDNGLSVDYDSTLDDKKRTTWCIVTHVAGHSRRAKFESEIDPGVGGSMNAIQKQGSTVSYGRRYALLMALGLVVEDEDDDGQASGNNETEGQSSGDSTLITKNNVAKITAMIGEDTALKQLVLGVYGVAVFDQIEKNKFKDCVARIEKYKAGHKK